MTNEITVAGPISGTPYRFRIEGARPTVDEQRNINAYLSSQEQAFQQRYAQVMGAPLDTGEGSGITNQFGELFKGIPRGIVGMLESGALGAAAVLPESLELPVREGIRRAGYAASRPFAPDIGLEGSAFGQFGEGLGSFAGLLGTAALSGPAALGLAVTGGAGEASERARAAEATGQERATASLLGAGVGASELIPIGTMFRMLGRATTLGMRQRIGRALAEGGIEGAQEAAANIAQNLIEQGIYNPERGTLEGAGESFAIGGGVGGLVQGLLDLAIPGRARTAPAATTTATPAATTTATPTATPTAPTPRRAPETGIAAVPADLDAFRGATEETVEAISSLADQFNVPPSSIAAVYRRMQGASDQNAEASAIAADLNLPASDIVDIADSVRRTGMDATKATAPDVETMLAQLLGMEAPSAQAGTLTTQQLANLGVGRSTALYKGVADGSLTGTNLIEALETYARRTRNAERAGRVRDLATTLSAVAPDAEGAAAQRAAIAEGDAASAAPAEPEASGEGVRADSGVVGDGRGRVADTRTEEPATPDGAPVGDAVPSTPAPAGGAGDVQPALTPRAPAPAYDPMSGQLPGGTTGTAGQVIPEGTPEATLPPEQALVAALRPELGRLPRDEASVDLGVAGLDDLTPAPARAVQNEIDTWFRQNSTPELRADVGEQLRAAGTADPVSTRRDRTLVLRLLQRGVQKDDRKNDNPEWAAYKYFRVNPNVSMVLEDIAYDVVDAGIDPRGYNQSGIAYHRGKGGDVALRAAEWVEANLSTNANEFMDNGIAEFSEQLEAVASDAAIESRDASLVKDRQANETIEETYGRDAEEVALKAHLQWLKDNIKGMRKEGNLAAFSTPLHPNTTRLLRAGDLRGALRSLSATVRDPRLSRLADQLARRLPDTVQSRVLSTDVMETLASVLDAGMNFSGVYIRNLSDAALAARPEYQRDTLRELANTVVLDEAYGLNPRILLHEAVHALAMETLADMSHPLARRLETLRAKLETAMGPVYALRDVDELLSEGMSNHRFRQELAQFNIDGSPVTALQAFMRELRNFLRGLVGLDRTNSPDPTVEIDKVYHALLSAPIDPNVAQGEGDLLSASFRGLPAMGEAMNGTKGRIAGFTNTVAARVDGMVGRGSVPEQIKELVLRGAVPLRNLVDLAKPYFNNAEDIFKLIEQHGATIHADSQRIKATTDKIANFLKRNPDKLDLFNNMRLAASLYQIDPRMTEKEFKKYKLWYDELDSNGRFTRRVIKSFDTIAARKTALDALNTNKPKGRSVAKRMAQPKPEEVQVHRELRKMHTDLGPEGQAAYEAALDIFSYFHTRTSEVLKTRVDALFGTGTSASERVYADIYAKIFSDNIIVPYQPLQRRGNFWLTYKVMKDDADVEGEQHKESFETLQEWQEARDELDRIAADGTRIEDIQFYEARNREQLRQPVPLEFAADVLRVVDTANLSPADRQNLQQQLTDLIFDAAPEKSYIQSYRARKNVKGFLGDPTSIRNNALGRQDTINLINQKGFSIARQLADIEYGQKLDAAMRNINQQVEVMSRTGGSTPEAVRNIQKATTYARVLTDYSKAIRQQRSELSRNITSGTYGLTLGANVSTAALTFMQFPTIIAPYLGAKYGFRQTTRAMGNAHRVLTGSGGSRLTESIGPGGIVQKETRSVNRFDYSLTNYDLDDPKNAALGRYRALKAEMKARGMDNRSITEDILDFDNPDNRFQRLVSWSGILQHHAERYTREVTAIATYDMELQKIASARGTNIDSLTEADYAQAANAALYTTEITNGTILAAGAPLWAQGSLGAIIYLYKRFGLHMFNLLANTALRSLPRNADPADRRTARLQLASMLGSVALFSGAQGMPLFQTFAQLWDLFFTDDDEEDFETLVRTGIGELGYSGVVNYVTGTSIASRIGLSGMFYREPFNADNQPWLFTQMEAIGGPAVGLAIRYTDRVPQLLNDGDYYRMTEALLPSAIANPLRAIRMSTEGVETLRGDPIVGDISPASAALQFFGFAPAEYIRQLEQNAALTRIDRAIQSDRTELLRRRYRAVAEGDRAEFRRVAQEIREFNRENPQYPIESETLRDSLRSHLETTSRMHHGVLFSTRNEAMLRRMAEDWGPASMWE